MLDLSSFGQGDIIIFVGVLVLAVIAMITTRRLLHISFPYFFMGILGLLSGLWIGSRLGSPFASLPGPYGRWIPMVINIVIAVAVLDLFLAQAQPITRFFSRVVQVVNHWLVRTMDIDNRQRTEIFVDTSVLIDGRLEEIARTGFVMGRLLVPRFVLEELQAIADQADSLKRTRGRRGLESLAAIQKISTVKLEITEDGLGRQESVDARLVQLAKRRPAKILTVDFNLNRVAQIQGVEVLNINELATSLRPQLIPGETVPVQVIQKGKEKGQGIGYLPDGTMIVVEGGGGRVGETVECEVIRIFQSVAGKMIFVEPKAVRSATP